MALQTKFSIPNVHKYPKLVKRLRIQYFRNKIDTN